MCLFDLSQAVIFLYVCQIVWIELNVDDVFVQFGPTCNFFMYICVGTESRSDENQLEMVTGNQKINDLFIKIKSADNTNYSICIS